MAVIHKEFCDWCGKEIPAKKWPHGSKIFPVKKRYWLYKGYGCDIDEADELFEDVICDKCKDELLNWIRTKKRTKGVEI